MISFRIALKSKRYVLPFNEPARDLRILNKPLWLIQRDVLAPYTKQEIDINKVEDLPELRESCIVFRDNLFFDDNYIKLFIDQAQEKNCAVCRYQIHMKKTVIYIMLTSGITPKDLRKRLNH